jgi:GDP-D-mannose dehydratase
MKKALIVGITCQDGSCLDELFTAKRYQVHGLVRLEALEDPKHLLTNICDTSPYFVKFSEL